MEAALLIITEILNIDFCLCKNGKRKISKREMWKRESSKKQENDKENIYKEILEEENADVINTFLVMYIIISTLFFINLEKNDREN